MSVLEKTPFEMLCIAIALNMGILPFEYKPNETLAKLDPEDAKKLKRKFRKLRRKVKKSARYDLSKTEIKHKIEMNIMRKARSALPT